MARRDGDIAGGLIGGAILLAVLFAAGIGILLWAMLSEIWNINVTIGRTGSRNARRILTYALVALIGVFVVSGLLATQPDTAPIGLFTACWALFIYVLVCIVTDRRERQKQVPVVMPAALSLDEVVSWRPASDSMMQHMSNRSNTV